ncbi:hypothetical protein [Vibrio spartinae]|uniref:Holin of 3TMs, for gene-transfer release n=1 Tax=Vibrio spartinae TaxID=1918945 RepID=A0A1N6M623_9VIBR|nr:hypothetical protein [Vibrio spartinae]SIO94807.1 hypothetical protein VSP9026_02537 [Vibrio spartinae]
MFASLAALALEAGPAVIRGISSLFGGSDTADKIASAVETVDNTLSLSKQQKQLAITRELQNLPPESRVELERIQLELEKEITRRQELQLQDKQVEHHETQETIRDGDKTEDPYIRKTRPLMARQSLWAVILYCFVMEFLKAKGIGTGVDPWVASILSSPAWAYLGLRTLDGFAKYPKGSGDKVTTLVGNVIKRK